MRCTTPLPSPLDREAAAPDHITGDLLVESVRRRPAARFRLSASIVHLLLVEPFVRVDGCRKDVGARTYYLSPTRPHRFRSSALRRVAPTLPATHLKRRWIVVATALAAILLTAQPAGAAQVSLMPRAGAPVRTITVLGVGYGRKALVRVRVGNRVRRVRTGPRGRLAVVVRLPRRARRVVVRGNGTRLVVPRFLVRSVSLQATVTVGPASRRVALYPYSATAGS